MIETNPSSYSQSFLKRLLDLVITIGTLPLVIPAVLLGILLLSFPLGSNVFFTQKRLGKGGAEFSILKLRTLKLGTTNDMAGMAPDGSDFVLFGHWLRRWRIDELPQVINVLKGEMSWIGPRPERPHLSLEAASKYPDFSKRCDVKPGLTGWAQVHLPNATPKENGEKLVYDLEYVRKASLGMDLRILLRTIRAVI